MADWCILRNNTATDDHWNYTLGSMWTNLCTCIFKDGSAQKVFLTVFNAVTLRSVGPKPVSAWQWNCTQSELHLEWNGRTITLYPMLLCLTSGPNLTNALMAEWIQFPKPQLKWSDLWSEMFNKHILYECDGQESAYFWSYSIKTAVHLSF